MGALVYPVFLEHFYTDGAGMKTNFTFPARKSTDSKPPQFGFSKEEQDRLFSHKLPTQPKPVIGPSRHGAMSSDEEWKAQKASDKAFLRRKEADLEELAPKKEGHAKQVEDRRLKAAYTRNEKNPLDFEVSDDVLMGGGRDNDYHRALQAEKERAARREEERQKRKLERDEDMRSKRERYERREQEVQEMLKKLIQKKQ